MSSPPLSVSVIQRTDTTVLVAAGDLDMETAPLLESIVSEQAVEAGLVIDLSGVQFIDSSGLRGLLRIRQRPGGLRLAAPSATVRRLLDLTDLTGAFTIGPAEDSEPS